MHNKNILPIAIIGVIIIALTVAAFFLLDIERTTLNYWAFAFLVLSEVVLFGGLLMLRFSNAYYSSLFLKSGIASALFLYFFTTLISMVLARWLGVNGFVLVQLGIVALFAVILIIIVVFSQKIEHQTHRDLDKVGSTEPKRGGF